MRFFYTSQFC